MARFVLVHEYFPYRDFEPEEDLQILTYTRITFNDEDHTAYAHLVDSTPEAMEPHGETVTLTWEEAEELINTEH